MRLPFIVLMLLGACASGEYSVGVAFQTEALRGQAVRVEVAVLTACDVQSLGSVPSAPLREVEFAVGGDAAPLGELLPDTYGLYARASNSECEVIAAGCSTIQVLVNGDDHLRVELLPSTGSYCEAGQFCDAGECVGDCVASCPMGTACIDGECVDDCGGGCGNGRMCVAGECVDVPGACEPDICAAEGGDAATCHVGECNGDLCVSRMDLACEEPGMLCCGGACISCETEDPCLQPTCEGGTCAFEPVAQGTLCNPDGLFCAGTGLCDGAGACADVRPSCEIACDEAADRCVGCVTSAGCPETLGDVDCDAVLAANPTSCREEAERVRTFYECAPDSNCAVTDVTGELVTCTRGNGASCGDVVIGVWSACTYGSTCDQTGTRTRTVATPVCQGDRCARGEVTETDTDGCNRATGGLACNVPDLCRPVGTCTDGLCAGTGCQPTDCPPCGGFPCQCGMSGSCACTG